MFYAMKTHSGIIFWYVNAILSEHIQNWMANQSLTTNGAAGVLGDKVVIGIRFTCTRWSGKMNRCQMTVYRTKLITRIALFLVSIKAVALLLIRTTIELLSDNHVRY